MTVSTQGLKLNWGSRTLQASVELLSSMRFSISLLTVICIASVIGTVLKQAEPLGNYVNQFGPFWAQVFGLASLNTVYSAWWFLLILAFLVISTSLCIARNAPKILLDLNELKENVREQSLKAFGHRAESQLAESPEMAARRIGQTLVQSGWKVKLQMRERPGGTGWMVAAKKGAANKLGYIAAHSAIVLICIGGLLDGDMIVRAQMWLQDKSTYTGGGLIADVPQQHRLSSRYGSTRSDRQHGGKDQRHGKHSENREGKATPRPPPGGGCRYLWLRSALGRIPQILVPQALRGGFDGLPAFFRQQPPRRLTAAGDAELAPRLAQPLVDRRLRTAQPGGDRFHRVAGREQAQNLQFLLGQRVGRDRRRLRHGP